MNNLIKKHNVTPKAGLMVCLFCFPQVFVLANVSPSSLEEADRLILSLHLKEARTMLNELDGPLKVRLVSLANVTELLLEDDAHLLNDFEPVFSNQIDALGKIKSPTADEYFTYADIRLQWAFVYLKFGEYFQAAWNLRQAHGLVNSCKEKYPSYTRIKKTSGLIEVVLGAVPDKFQWLLGLFGMQGSVATGVQELKLASRARDAEGLEAQLLFSLIKGYALHETQAAVKDIDSLLVKQHDNRLLMFVGASLALKDNQNEHAIALLKQMEQTSGLTFALEYYMSGEAYLRKGTYDAAIHAYGNFLNASKGQSDRKDAHYKIGLCYWIEGDSIKAKDYFDRARNQGDSRSEADAYADQELNSGVMPNVKLSQMRYLTDGGYFEEARHVAASVSPGDLPTRKDEVEYYYRKARIAHRSGQKEAAGLFYRQVIDMTADEPWYFAPNSCLQLGYIAREANRTDEARTYFHKALNYKKHEYKSSIQSEARSALAALDKK